MIKLLVLALIVVGCTSGCKQIAAQIDPINTRFERVCVDSVTYLVFRTGHVVRHSTTDGHPVPCM